MKAPPDAPANPYRGVPLGQRAASFEQNLATVAGQVDQNAAIVFLAWSADNPRLLAVGRRPLAAVLAALPGLT